MDGPITFSLNQEPEFSHNGPNTRHNNNKRNKANQLTIHTKLITTINRTRHILRHNDNNNHDIESCWHDEQGLLFWLVQPLWNPWGYVCASCQSIIHSSTFVVASLLSTNISQSCIIYFIIIDSCLWFNHDINMQTSLPFIITTITLKSTIYRNVEGFRENQRIPWCHHTE